MIRGLVLTLKSLCFALAVVPLAHGAGETRAVLDGHPYDTAAALQEALDPLIAAGGEEMDLLLAAVTDRTSDDTAARTAIEALTHYMGRRGTPAGQRAAWASALVRALPHPELSLRRLAL